MLILRQLLDNQRCQVDSWILCPKSRLRGECWKQRCHYDQLESMAKETQVLIWDARQQSKLTNEESDHKRRQKGFARG